MENIAITNTKYSVDLLNKYPHVIFVFGDNMIRKGKGGQAIIRDCQNSFGISTKRYPKNTQDAFYSDREDEINTTLRDMEQFKRLVLNGKPVILPRGGIGTGLAKYGVTTDNNPLSLRAWLQHALEEALDMANYLQAAISKLDEEGN